MNKRFGVVMNKQVKLYQSDVETLTIVFDSEQQSGWEGAPQGTFEEIAKDIIRQGYLAQPDAPDLELDIDVSDTLCATYDTENGILTVLNEDCHEDCYYPDDVACYFLGLDSSDFNLPPL